MNFYRLHNEEGKKVKMPFRCRFGIVSLLAFTALACFASASALASTAHEFESSFGPDGTEGTHFEAPGAVAVDQGTHDVYVADLEAGTVSKFDESGHPA